MATYHESYSPEAVSVDEDGAFIEAIFSTSYSTMPGECFLLSMLIRQGVIDVLRVGFHSMPVPDATNHEQALEFKDACYGGGYGHSLLKWNAFHFLKSMGSPAPRYEQGWYHGRADVVCEDLQIAIECGSTAPMHVVRCLSAKDAREFWLFPFPGADGKHYGYRFRRGASFNQEVMDETNWTKELVALNALTSVNSPAVTSPR